MQTPLQHFDDHGFHAAASASSGSSDYDLAEAERLRKQRDLKRKSRERKKRDLEELQATAATLEAQYNQLLAVRLLKQQQQQQQQQHLQQHEEEEGERPASPTESRLALLKDNYMALRDEARALRNQMSGFKLKIDEYERFIATLDGQLLLVFHGASSGLMPVEPGQETRQARPTSSMAASQFQFD